MNTLLAEQSHQAYIDYLAAQGSEREAPVIFLTDRETAQATAVAALGPLALMFDRDPITTPPFGPATEYAHVLVEAFSSEAAVETPVRLEVPTVSPERLQGQAALYFAAREYSLN